MGQASTPAATTISNATQINVGNAIGQNIFGTGSARVVYANGNFTVPAGISSIRVAVTEGGVPSTDDYVTYNKLVLAGDVLEETGIVCSAGEQVYVYCDNTNVSVRVHGFEESA